MNMTAKLIVSPLFDESVAKDIREYSCTTSVRKILSSNEKDVTKSKLIIDCILEKKQIYIEKRKEYEKKRHKSPKRKKWIEEYNKKPEVIKRKKEYNKEYPKNNKDKIDKKRKETRKSNPEKYKKLRKIRYDSEIKECREYLGVYCYILGVEFLYDQYSDIHHIDQTTKSFNIGMRSHLIKSNPYLMKLELNKCVLLHPIIHDLIHGELNEIKMLMGIKCHKFLPSWIYHTHWQEFCRRYKGKTEEEINRLCDYPIEDKYDFVKSLPHSDSDLFG